ncbi:hypothetical protein [Absidia glauca]|uniref:G-protein coupled receptors family 1 profile domain-containing protein n=1 Tax=Absidia glauca TaxID=4829 RepID=A0A168NGI9_ABSGL|nr:hypothetical protein [Absidia glauca]
MENTSKSLFYVCVNGVCHCDFRISVSNCHEELHMKTVYYVTIGITSLIVLFGLILLFRRICIQGHTFIDKRSSKGCLRPHPMDCLLLFCTIFNILRLLDNGILVTNAGQNPIVRTFFWELSWEFLYTGFVLYVLGVAQTLRDSHQAVSKGWLPSAKSIDRSISALLICMVMTNMTCAFASGALAESNHFAARGFTYALYYSWFVYCAILAVTILYCGVRLIRILESHLENFSMPIHRINNIKTGIFKIKCMVFVGFFGAIIYGVSMLLFAILRQSILITPGGGLTLSLIWNLMGPFCTGGVEVAMVFSAAPPDMGKVLGLKSSSNNNTSNNNNTDHDQDDVSFGDKSNDGNVYSDTTIITQHAATNEPWQTRPISLQDTERLQLEYQNAIEHLRQYGPTTLSTKITTV